MIQVDDVHEDVRRAQRLRTRLVELGVAFSRNIDEYQDGLDLTREDSNPDVLFNEIIWKSVHGEASATGLEAHASIGANAELVGGGGF